MELIRQQVTLLGAWVDAPDKILPFIEIIGRTCYKSEERITDVSAAGFVRMLINRGHEAMLEHVSITAKFVTDRGISHELVRHRIASYAQESTRYVNYTKPGVTDNGVRFIDPSEAFGWKPQSILRFHLAKDCEYSETAYKTMMASGAKPEQARQVLNQALATEINMTANLREWRHFLTLRCAPVAHPLMRELALQTLQMMHSLVDVVFDDLYQEYFPTPQELSPVSLTVTN